MRFIKYFLRFGKFCRSLYVQLNTFEERNDVSKTERFLYLAKNSLTDIMKNLKMSEVFFLSFELYLLITPKEAFCFTYFFFEELVQIKSFMFFNADQA